ncbi:MAG: hypothetical protein AAB481_02730 [Patescibacteria group bacterium]
MRPLQKLSLEQRRVLVDIFVTTSQVTFGIAWATLLFPPLDAVKGLAILVSVLATIILWYFAFYVTKVKNYEYAMGYCLTIRFNLGTGTFWSLHYLFH